MVSDVQNWWEPLVMRPQAANTTIDRNDQSVHDTSYVVLVTSDIPNSSSGLGPPPSHMQKTLNM